MFLPKLSVMVVFSFWEVGGGRERERERGSMYFTVGLTYTSLFLYKSFLLSVHD